MTCSFCPHYVRNCCRAVRGDKERCHRERREEQAWRERINTWEKRRRDMLTEKMSPRNSKRVLFVCSCIPMTCVCNAWDWKCAVEGDTCHVAYHSHDFVFTSCNDSLCVLTTICEATMYFTLLMFPPFYGYYSVHGEPVRVSDTNRRGIDVSVTMEDRRPNWHERWQGQGGNASKVKRRV